VKIGSFVIDPSPNLKNMEVLTPVNSNEKAQQFPVIEKYATLKADFGLRYWVNQLQCSLRLKVLN
jgi:hypothetical protein